MKFLKNMHININNININNITLIQIYIAILLLGIIFHSIKHINRYIDINSFLKDKITSNIVEGLEGNKDACKDMNHSAYIDIDKCDKPTRDIINEKLLNKNKFTKTSGFEKGINWCTSNSLRYEVKDKDGPIGNCFNSIIENIQTKCMDYYNNNINSTDDDDKKDAEEAKSLIDKFKKVVIKKVKWCNDEKPIGNPPTDIFT